MADKPRVPRRSPACKKQASRASTEAHTVGPRTPQVTSKAQPAKANLPVGVKSLDKGTRGAQLSRSRLRILKTRSPRFGYPPARPGHHQAVLADKSGKLTREIRPEHLGPAWEYKASPTPRHDPACLATSLVGLADGHTSPTSTT